jgi:cytoskeletal protein CcmA (bactofilin family)
MVEQPAQELSILDRHLTITGTVSSQGRLIIQGSLTGRLDADTVIITEQGRVQAEAHVNRITIQGRFEGQLEVLDELTILAGGRCTGTVNCGNFAVEAGGVLNAEVTCTLPGGRETAAGALDAPAQQGP